MQSIVREMLTIKRLCHVYASSIRGGRTGLYTESRQNDGFIYITGGSCAYTPDIGEPFVARAGDVIYLANGAGYRMTVGEEEYAYICVNFEFEGDEKRLCMLTSPDVETETEALFRKLCRTVAGGRRQGVFEAMALLYRIYGVFSLSGNREYIGRTVKEAVAECKARMDRRFSDTALSVSALARSAGMSDTYFRTLFRSQYGTSPLQYLIGLRLGLAISLMSDPLLSLDACAEASGFSSLSYFCRIFKRKMGITPAGYRREMRVE